MTPTPPPPSNLLDPTGRLRADLPCLKCTYNLRTLAHDALCPECATPVARSLHGHSLNSCDPAWLQTLSRGALLGSIGVAGLAGSVLVGLLLAPSAHSYNALTFLDQALSLLALLSIPACWMLTTPERHALRSEPKITFRRLFRLTGLAGTALLLGSLFLGQFTLLNPLTSIAGFLGFILLPIAALAFLLQTFSLARRLHDRWTHLAALLLAVVLTLLLAPALYKSIFSIQQALDAAALRLDLWLNLPARSPWSSQGAIHKFLNVNDRRLATALFTFVSAAALFLSWLSLRLRRCAHIARTTWAITTPPTAPAATPP